MQIVLNNFGEYLGVHGQNFVVYKNKKPLREIPFYQTKQVIIKSGNNVSSSALFWCAVHGIETVIISPSGKPLSLLIPLNSDARVKTRTEQYRAYFNHKGIEIAKAILKTKVECQASLLEKYGMKFKRFDLNLERIKGKNVEEVRTRLVTLEGTYSRKFFKQYFLLFPRYLQSSKRNKRFAPDALNNLMNLSYQMLKGEIYKAVLYAHLDPYLGFLHSIQFAKPSMVCDLQELFRSLIQEFLIHYVRKLDPETSFEQKGKRTFLTLKEEGNLIRAINNLFDKRIAHQRIKKFGKRSKIRTAIREEPIKIGQFLREQKPNYTPINIMSKIKEMKRFV